MQLLLLGILWLFVGLHARVLDRIEAAADEYLQAAIEDIAARANQVVGHRDGCHAQDVVGDSEGSEGETQQGNNCDSLAREQRVDRFEIPEYPR